MKIAIAKTSDRIMFPVDVDRLVEAARSFGYHLDRIDAENAWMEMSEEEYSAKWMSIPKMATDRWNKIKNYLLLTDDEPERQDNIHLNERISRKPNRYEVKP